MTKVGLVTSPRTPSPAPIPWVSVVLPAPRSPVSTMRSPASSIPASRSPSSRIAAAVATVAAVRGSSLRPCHAAPSPARRHTGGHRASDRGQPVVLSISV